MLHNCKIKTKLPSFDIHKETEEKAEIWRQHYEKKLRQKKYFDKRKKVAPKPINVVEQILVKQDKTSKKLLFNPDPFKVTSVEGNRVTAVNGRKKVTRDKNQFKVLHPHAIALKPSWEKGVSLAATPHTIFKGSPLSELPKLSDDDLSDQTDSGSNIGIASNQDQVQQDVNEAVDDSRSGQSPVRVHWEIAAPMEMLFAQAEQALQETAPPQEGACDKKCWLLASVESWSEQFRRSAWNKLMYKRSVTELKSYGIVGLLIFMLYMDLWDFW